MLPSKKKDLAPADAPLFDPFPKPQTLPEGWDLSGLVQEPGLPIVPTAGTQAEN